MNKKVDTDQLYAMRHSLAHIMATAIMRLWPKAKLGVGPVIDDGFYYDIDIEGTNISEDDFLKIEAEMKKIIDAGDKFIYSEQNIESAIDWAKKADQTYKLELLNDLKQSGTTAVKDLNQQELESITENGSKVDNVSFYTNGEFTDLCRGPHVKKTNDVGAFRLVKVAGAYWRGNQNNPQMQRLYGVAFTTEAELEQYLKNQDLAKQNDHRRLGGELDLFVSSSDVGSGLPLFTPRGTQLRDLLGRYSQSLLGKRGYDKVWTPHITKTDLYKKSGHMTKFGDELFLVSSQETSDELVLKPMNCPHHIQIFRDKQRSYRDMPVKYMEITTDYRDEKSGELHGLSRVRSLTQDDSHAFVTEDQVEQATLSLIEAAKELYSELKMDLKLRLSFRDNSDNYLGDQALWDKAQKILEKVAKDNKLDYFVVEGEAAFYGPKIDFMVTDGLGREWQTSTVQLDFVQPDRFELEYTDSSGSALRPVMIHCALLGTIERFLSVYIEHTAGHFPYWLAPEQIRILSVNNEVDDYIKQVEGVLGEVVLMEPLKFNELRYTVDRRDESLGKKIREAETMKVPVMLIVGSKDAEANQVSVRTAGGEQKLDLDKLKEWVESFKG